MATMTNIIGSILTGLTLICLALTLAIADPASKLKKFQVGLVLWLLWLMFTVNIMQYMPTIVLAWLDSHSLLVSSSYRIMFNVSLCILGSVMSYRLYKKYIQNRKSIMATNTGGEFVKFPILSQMQKAFEEQFPGLNGRFWFHKSMMQTVLDTEGSEYVHIELGFEDNQIHPIVYPSDANGERIPLDPLERGLMRGEADSDEEDDDDYGLDKGGTTFPPGKG